jgi:hypothetical protein
MMMAMAAVPMTAMARVMAMIIVAMTRVTMGAMIVVALVMTASAAMGGMPSERGLRTARIPVQVAVIPVAAMRLWPSVPTDPLSRVVILPRACCAHISCFPVFLKNLA